MRISLVGLLCLLGGVFPSVTQAASIREEIEIVIPPMIEIYPPAQYKSEIEGVNIINSSQLQLRANTSWSLEAFALSSGFSQQPAVYLDGKAGKTDGSANINNRYQDIVVESQQPFSWADLGVSGELVVIYRATSSI